ncbi:MAG: glycosyltransferase family 9 protein [Candidatus Margulisiibacteriota bacterium]
MKLDLSKVREILLVRPEQIGDTILLTPLVSQIKEKLPNARITLLIKKSMAPVVERNPQIDGLIFTENKNDVLKKKFDLSIVFEDNPLPEYAWLCFKARIPCRIGDKNRLLYRFMYNCGVPLDPKEDLHQVESFGRLLKPLGINMIDKPALIVTDRDMDEKIKNLLPDGKPLIGMHIGTGGGNRALSPEAYALILDNVKKSRDCNIVLIGGPQETVTIEKIKEAAEGGFINMVNKVDLKGMLSLIKRLDCFIGVDSGPMHAAAALGIPCLAIFTAKDVNPKKWAPWKTRSVIMRSKHNCQLKCSHRKCGYDYCARQVDPQELISSLNSLCG